MIHRCCFYITSNIRFLNLPVYLQTLKDMTYSLHSLCTFFGLLLWGLLPWQTSIVPVYFQNKQSVYII